MTQAHPGDEGRRQAYLAALGIPLWSARVALPGALPCEPLAFMPFVEEAPAAQAEPPPLAVPGGDALPAPAGLHSRSPAPEPGATAPTEASPAHAEPLAQPHGAPGAAVPPHAQGGAAAAAGSGRAPAPAGRSAAPTDSATDAPRRPLQDERFPRVSCRAWSLAPGISAVIALDDAPDLAAAEYRLLDNIARALDAGDMPAAVGELLRWPLNRNPALDHGPEALHTWLSHALRLPPGRCVVFGEALAGHVAAALPGTVVVAAPALGELLADAGAKRRLWQALHG